ncbi:MAG: response regulator, partial [Anaerolineae bacterium]
MPSLVPEGSLRILLISADEAVRNELRQVLNDARVEHRLFWVSEPGLAVERADEVIAHVVLVDETLGGRDPVPLIRRLVGSVSGASVLALVQEAATRRAAQAVLAGARGFVTKPLADGDLVAALRQVMAPGREVPDLQEAGG